MKSASSVIAAPGTYIPGYVLPKIVMLALGVLLLAGGVVQLWTPMRLSFSGKSVDAEAVRIVESSAGAPDRILHNALELEAEREPRDRNVTFWNVFAFRTSSNQPVEVRANVGSHAAPLFPLVDADGLVTTELVCYDPARPQNAVFPLLIGTWVVGGLLTFGGLGFVSVGAVLLRWANTSIELPHIPTAAEVAALHAQASAPPE